MNIKQGCHNPGVPGKPGKIFVFWRSQGKPTKLGEMDIFLLTRGKLRENVLLA